MHAKAAPNWGWNKKKKKTEASDRVDDTAFAQVDRGVIEI
jgi:hypothetical protein